MYVLGFSSIFLSQLASGGIVIARVRGYGFIMITIK